MNLFRRKTTQNRQEHLVFYDFFKIIAIVTMFADHIGYYFFPHTEILRVIGRMSAPIFFFLVGYSRSTTVDFKLFAYAILLQIVYLTINPEFQALNVLFTIAILRICNSLFPLFKLYTIFFLFIIVAATTTYTMYYVEYGTIAILFSLLGYYVQKKRTPYFLYFLGIPIGCLHVLIQQEAFHFYTHNFILLVILLATVVTLFIYFHQFNYKILIFNKDIMKVMAKHALIIYFVHKALLEISALLVSYANPPAPSQYLQDERLIEKDLLQPNI